MVTLIKMKRVKRKRNIFEKILFVCGVIFALLLIFVFGFLAILESLGSDKNDK